MNIKHKSITQWDTETNLNINIIELNHNMAQLRHRHLSSHIGQHIQKAIN